MGGVALDGLDQVGDQVEAALELHVDLGPGGVDAVAQRHQAVVGDHEEADEQHQDHDQHDDEDHGVIIGPAPARPGCRSRPARRARRSASASRSMEKCPARCSPEATSSAAHVGSASTRRSASASARASPGRHQQRVAPGAGHVGVAGEVAGHDRASRRPWPRAARRRRTRRASDGAQNTSAARRRRAFSSSLMRPSHSMRVSPATQALQRLGVGAVAGDPEADVRREVGHGLEQHRQALARLVATDEQDHGPSAARRASGGSTHGVALAKVGTSTPLNSTV